MTSNTGAYPEIFRGKGFEVFCMNGIFFLKSPSKLKKISQKRGWLDPQKPYPEYAPGPILRVKGVLGVYYTSYKSGDKV